MRLRASRPGSGMYTRFSKRRLMAGSSCHGMLVAPRTRTPVSSCPTPFIWTRNSVLMRREPSDSDSLRVPARESTSSIKMMAGLFSRANSNKFLTSLGGHDDQGGRERKTSELTHLSESPCHLLTRSLELTLKNVLLASVATAFAR